MVTAVTLHRSGEALILVDNEGYAFSDQGVTAVRPPPLMRQCQPGRWRLA